jgi:hypothetical protein
MVAAFRPPRVLSRGIAWAGRNAASRALAPCNADSREASETGPPLLRAEREELTGGEAFLLHHRAGPKPKTAAVERRKASVPEAQATRKHCLRGTQGAPNGSAVTRDLCARGPALLARERVPLHPSACRRSASLISE